MLNFYLVLGILNVLIVLRFMYVCSFYGFFNCWFLFLCYDLIMNKKLFWFCFYLLRFDYGFKKENFIGYIKVIKMLNN